MTAVWSIPWAARRAGRGEPPRPCADLERELAALEPFGEGVAAARTAASRASLLVAARDPRATVATLDAARRLLWAEKLLAASDVLLDCIAHGLTNREVQHLLIEVDQKLGCQEIAREKCLLLQRLYEADGNTQVAAAYERLVRIF